MGILVGQLGQQLGRKQIVRLGGVVNVDGGLCRLNQAAKILPERLAAVAGQVGRRDADCVRAGVLIAADHINGVPVARNHEIAHHRDAPAGGAAHGLHQLLLFIQRHHIGFAGYSVGKNSLNSVVHLPVHHVPDCSVVNAAVWEIADGQLGHGAPEPGILFHMAVPPCFPLKLRPGFPAAAAAPPPAPGWPRTAGRAQDLFQTALNAGPWSYSRRSGEPT